LSVISRQLLVVTDDGSRGRKGFVTDEFKDLLADKTVEIDRVMAKIKKGIVR